MSPALQHFYLAQSHETRDEHASALKEIDAAVRLDPSNVDFYILKTKILLEQDRSSEAAKTAMLALERSPKAIRPILAVSDDFYLEDAKKIYARTIALGTKEILPYLGIGNIALHYGDLKEAEKWFERAKQIQPEHSSVLLAWGRLMVSKGDLKKARQFLEQARDKGEDSTTLHGTMGDIYLKLQLWEEAIRSYRTALRNQKKNAAWRRSLGIALAQMGRLREAEEKFREVLALEADDADAWRELRKLGKKY